MAALWNLPVIYIIENNQYGMGTSVKRASAMTELFRRGESFGIKGYEVDGMDPLSLNLLLKKIYNQVLNDNKGPVLIEAKTYGIEVIQCLIQEIQNQTGIQETRGK